MSEIMVSHSQVDGAQGAGRDRDKVRPAGFRRGRWRRSGRIAALFTAFALTVAGSNAGQGQQPEQAGISFRDCEHCPEMVVVPAGAFLMGSPETEAGRTPAEGPQHEVRIARPFAVGKFEITFDEWDACIAAGGCTRRPGDEGWGRGRRPVINVSWNDTQQYVAWLSRRTVKSYRLLSEAEWEYAARAGAATAYPWGNEPGTNRANFDGSESEWSGRQTAPVGSFAPNAFGLYDMIGNVWERVQDCRNESYEGAPADGSARESGDCDLRMLRGGSWIDKPASARAAFRVRSHPDHRNHFNGFRVARTL